MLLNHLKTVIIYFAVVTVTELQKNFHLEICVLLL